MTDFSIDGAVRWATSMLLASGIDRPRHEARLLLRHTSNLGIESQISCSTDEIEDPCKFEQAVLRRARREPFAHIIGLSSFWKHEFQITPDVLIPRPETETIIEAALACYASDQPPRTILDIGTGSGCLLLSLLAEFNDAEGVGTDLSANALRCAGTNIQALDLRGRARLVLCKWTDALAGPFDLLVSNPPYLSTQDMMSLQPELDHEPALALGGGADGLEAYRQLASDIGRVIVPGGLVLLEIGRGQEVAVDRIFHAAGFVSRGRHHDLAGITRVLAYAVK